MGDAYFEWLCEKVEAREETKCFLNILHSTEFVAKVENDENRAVDGNTLRYEFEYECTILEVKAPKIEMSMYCSVLEMMVALARRITFIRPGATSSWFWEMVENLMRDSNGLDIYEMLDRLINREYDVNGFGGLFPLLEPPCDQRKVEIWTQMHAYCNEKYPF